MSNAELIYEEVKTLPENRTAQILDFVKYIKQEEARSAESASGAAAENETDDSWFERGEPCPICAKHRDSVTGNPRYKPEIYAGMQEVEDMISGKRPAKWYKSLEEMMIALEEDN